MSAVGALWRFTTAALGCLGCTRVWVQEAVLMLYQEKEASPVAIDNGPQWQNCILLLPVHCSRFWPGATSWAQQWQLLSLPTR